MEVGVGGTGILTADNNACIWTGGMQSCFPVVFLYRNGDIGLYHGNSVGIDTVETLLAHGEVTEIQLFSKSTHMQNRTKVEEFSKSLQRHFANRDPKPAINIQVPDDRAAYGTAVCYKAADGRPVVLVGTSLEHNGMAETLAECHNQTDTVRPYRFEPVVNQYPLAAPTPPTPEPTSTVIEMQLKMREAMRGLHEERKAKEGAEAAAAAELDAPPPSKDCCPIL